MRLTGILGGTFDPVHNGHIGIAEQAISQFELDTVRLMPLYRPAHRPLPEASPVQRREMLRLALAEHPGLLLDERELVREGVSWSIDSLRSLRQELPGNSLVMLLGEDAFHQLDSWREWKHLSDYSHILVVRRKHRDARALPSTIAEWAQKRLAQDGRIFTQGKCGRIARMETTFPVSSSAVRQQLAAGLPVNTMLPPPVAEYIHTQGLYQRKQ